MSFRLSVTRVQSTPLPVVPRFLIIVCHSSPNRPPFFLIVISLSFSHISLQSLPAAVEISPGINHRSEKNLLSLMALSRFSKRTLSPKKEIQKKIKKAKREPFESQENTDSIQQQQQQVPPPPRKRTRSPGLRIIGGRIYDSEHGKTCHQCRQKTMDFVAACKVMKGDKPCTIMFCLKCLLNRYGEKSEDMEQTDDWECPRCRGICNCSFCMKKRGHQPTGILVHAAKATGFQSVSEMQTVNDPNKESLK